MDKLGDQSAQIGFELKTHEPRLGSRAVSADFVFGDIEELELTSRFLEVTNEQEFATFLNDLMSCVSRRLDRSLTNSARRSLGRLILVAGRKVFPTTERIFGSSFNGLPQSRPGFTLVNPAGRIFGLELEGLSPEDQELEIARRFVRFAGAAAKRAAIASNYLTTEAMTKSAVECAARKYAPGLTKSAGRSIMGQTKTRDEGLWDKRKEKHYSTLVKETAMHDLDTTMNIHESEFDDTEFEQGKYQEFEEEADDFGEFEMEFPGDEEFEGYEFEEEFETDAEGLGQLSDQEIKDLAMELLTMPDEAELEQFIGKVLKHAARVVTRPARRAVQRLSRRARHSWRSRIGRYLRKGLRGVARRALPYAGGAVGTYFGGPAGGAIGRRLAPNAGRKLGLEFEAMGPEEQEFEIAKRVVRLTADAAKGALTTPATGSPEKVAKSALSKAVLRHTPWVLKNAGQCPHGGSSGRWVRRGQQIILYGV